MMKFLLTDKYTLLYILMQILILISIIRNSEKYKKTSIISCIILVLFDYVYLSLNYTLKH